MTLFICCLYSQNVGARLSRGLQEAKNWRWPKVCLVFILCWCDKIVVIYQSVHHLADRCVPMVGEGCPGKDWLSLEKFLKPCCVLHLWLLYRALKSG